MHTKVFLDKNWVNTLLINLIFDNVNNILELVRAKGIDRDGLKELQILAAFLGSKAVFNHLTDSFELAIDDEVLNMAIMSGQFVGTELHGLTKTTSPTYNSIRYAIKSENVAVLKELVDSYGLKLGSEHFVVAASVGSLGMFDEIINHGVTPNGLIVYKAAVASGSKDIISRLVALGYRDDPSGVILSSPRVPSHDSETSESVASMRRP